MEAVFLKLLNMSITASYLVLAVVLVRLLLKRAPKFITVILWGLVAIRLMCPFSLESVLSLIPSAETVPNDIMYAENPQIYSGISQVNTAVNNIILPALKSNPAYSVNPMQVVVFIASIVWLMGIAVMLLYTAVSYIRIYLKVREAVNIEDNIFECDRIATPFILGIVKPRIYLPSGISSNDLEYVISHERMHISRRDNLWKPLGFLLLTVYWFNPVLWLGYILLCRDIELACDEKVIKNLGEQNKKPYSQALINCSVAQKMITACPLAFGETGVKSRIKSVLNYKKPAFWVIAAAIALSVAVSVCFMTNPKGKAITEIPDNFVFNRSMFDETENISIICDKAQYVVTYDGDIEKIVKQLKKVRVRKDPISKSRTEDRDKTNCISLKYSTLYFNKDFTELWGIDLLKPSYSYKVLNPETAEKAFKIAESNSGTNNTQVYTTEQIEELKKKYPQYFGLSTAKGLVVYVWQMSENNYKCHLLPGKNLHYADKDMNFLGGATVEEMKAIISSYNISSDKIVVLPYRNPLSSYYYAIDGEYIEKLKSLLGSTNDEVFYKPNEATTTTASIEDLNFKATILKVYDNGRLLVEPFADEEEYNIAKKIAVSVKAIEEYGSTSLVKGDKIRIVYDGMVYETYPAQINADSAFLISDSEN